jgi:hypothetical protein
LNDLLKEQEANFPQFQITGKRTGVTRTAAENEELPGPLK